MNQDKILRYSFNFQLGFDSLAIILAGLKQPALFFLLLINLLVDWPTRFKHLHRLNLIVQLIVQTILLPLSIVLLLNYFHVSLYATPVVILICLYLLVMYLPLIYLLFRQIKNKLSQLLVLLYEVTFLTSGAMTEILFEHPDNIKLKFLADLIGANMIGALMALIIIPFTMYLWGYALPKVRLAAQANKWIVFLLLVLSTWYVIWNATGDENFFKSLLSYDFTGFKLTSLKFMNGLEAGLAEEICFRYGLLTILIAAFKRYRNSLWLAALVSSLLFGLTHLVNLSAGQDLSNTLTQIIAAFGVGIFFAGLYLYTEQIHLTMIIHSALDILQFAMTSEIIMTNGINPSDWIGIIIEAIIFVLIGYFLISATQRRESQINVFD